MKKIQKKTKRTYKGFFGIIRLMAKLLSQRGIVKQLNDFFKNTGYSSRDAYWNRIGNLNEGGIPEIDFLGHLKTKESWKDFLYNFFRKEYFSSPKYQLNRLSKINNLYKSCLDDEFIEYRSGNNKIINISNKGSDLIHMIGFLEIVLSKYSEIAIFISGAFSILIIKLLLHIIFDIGL